MLDQTIGIDVSLRQNITVTDKLDISINGTFFAVNGSQRYYGQAKTLKEHPRPDMNNHDTEFRIGVDTIQSFFNVMEQGYIFNVSQLVEKFTGQPLSSDHFSWLPNLKMNYPQSIPIGLAFGMSSPSEMIIEEGWIAAIVNLRWIVNGEDQPYCPYMDFELEKFNFTFEAYTNYDEAIMGKVDSLRYESSKIVSQGTILDNPRDIDKISEEFDSMKNYLNGYVWGSNSPDWIRAKNLVGDIYFQNFIVDPTKDLITVGLDLDPLYNKALRNEFTQF